MQIKVTPEAKKLLAKYAQNNVNYLLTLNDGVNKYSNMGSCASVLAFQMVVLDHQDPVYHLKMANNFDLPIFTGERELEMFGDGLELKVRNSVLSLVSNEGVIDDAVMINDLRKDKTTFVLKQE